MRGNPAGNAVEVRSYHFSSMVQSKEIALLFRVADRAAVEAELAAAIGLSIEKYATSRQSRRISPGYEAGRFERLGSACCDPVKTCLPPNQVLAGAIVRGRFA